MVEGYDASAANASADQGAEEPAVEPGGAEEPTTEPAEKDPVTGQKYIRFDALQQMIIDSLSERSQVLRELRDRYEQEGFDDFPKELFGRWSCSIVTLQADLEAQDIDSLIKDLEAAGFFKDDDMINRLSLILAQRLFNVPPPAGRSSASRTTPPVSQPAPDDPRTPMQRAVQVLTALPANMAIAVLGHAPGSPHDKIALLPRSLQYIAALSMCPGLASACALATQATQASTSDAQPSPALFTICVEIKQAPTSVARSALVFDSGGPCEGAPGESDMWTACMEDVSGERLWIWSPKFTASDVAEERARRSALGMTPDDDAGPETRYSLKRKVSSVGCTLSCERLLCELDVQLPDNLRVVFSSSSGAVHLKDIKFQGGCIVCLGSGCEATFEDVVFDKCSLLVLDGAHVSLTRPQFQDMASSAAGLSICVDGSGTEVIVNGGSIARGCQGILLQAGASLQASNFNITGIEGTAVEAKDQGSALTLSNCTLSDFVPFDEERQMYRMHAVHVFGGASAQLSTVSISGACFGVEVSTGASAQLVGCRVASAAVACVRVRKGGTGSLKDCTIEDAKDCGLCVNGGGSRADTYSCRFLRNIRGCGAQSGGVLAADGCESSESERGGFHVADKGVLEVIGCTSVRDGGAKHAACASESGGTFTGCKVVVTSSRGDGFRAEGGGHMHLRGCSASQCAGCGISSCETEGSQMVTEGCNVE